MSHCDSFDYPNTTTMAPRMEGVRIRTVTDRNIETVVTALERLLEKAKAGEIVSFVSISQLKGGGWFEQSSGVSDMFKQLGMAEMAVTAIRERMLGR